MLPPIFNVGKNYDYVIVSDMYASDYPGGAEQTLEAILQKCPGNYLKAYPGQVNSYMIESAKDRPWIIGNCAGFSKDQLIEIATSGISYSKIECDYACCIHRSSHLHKIRTGKDCDCHLTDHGRLILGFYKRAQKVSFMSEGQLNEYKRLFPVMNTWKPNKLVVQGSTFSQNSLDLIKNLSVKYPVKNGKWFIQGGGNTSWIKNTQGAIDYCVKNNLEYEIVGGLAPVEFLEKLAQFHGLVFLPAGFDTNPRITLEARMMGLELVLNDNVQQRHDSWFNLSPSELIIHHANLAEKFWK